MKKVMLLILLSIVVTGVYIGVRHINESSPKEHPQEFNFLEIPND